MSRSYETLSGWSRVRARPETRGQVRTLTPFGVVTLDRLGEGPAVAKLTPTQRAKLPARDFGLPEKARSGKARKETGNYPIPDRGHAISAKRLRHDGHPPAWGVVVVRAPRS